MASDKGQDELPCAKPVVASKHTAGTSFVKQSKVMAEEVDKWPIFSVSRD